MDRAAPRAAGYLNENEAALAFRISARLDRLRRIEDITREWLSGQLRKLPIRSKQIGSQLAMRQIANLLAEEDE